MPPMMKTKSAEDDETYLIENILNFKLNEASNTLQYLIKYEGYEEPEWCDSVDVSPIMQVKFWKSTGTIQPPTSLSQTSIPQQTSRQFTLISKIDTKPIIFTSTSSYKLWLDPLSKALRLDNLGDFISLDSNIRVNCAIKYGFEFQHSQEVASQYILEFIDPGLYTQILEMLLQIDDTCNPFKGEDVTTDLQLTQALPHHLIQIVKTISNSQFNIDLRIEDNKKKLKQLSFTTTSSMVTYLYQIKLLRDALLADHHHIKLQKYMSIVFTKLSQPLAIEYSLIKMQFQKLLTADSKLPISKKVYNTPLQIQSFINSLHEELISVNQLLQSSSNISPSSDMDNMDAPSFAFNTTYNPPACLRCGRSNHTYAVSSTSTGCYATSHVTKGVNIPHHLPPSAVSPDKFPNRATANHPASSNVSEIQPNTKSTNNHSNKLKSGQPPTACNICTSLGFTGQFHWHSKCPYYKTKHSISQNGPIPTPMVPQSFLTQNISPETWFQQQMQLYFQQQNLNNSSLSSHQTDNLASSFMVMSPTDFPVSYFIDDSIPSTYNAHFDCGSNNNIINNRASFITYTSNISNLGTIGNNTKSIGYGIAVLPVIIHGRRSTISLLNALHVPSSPTNLISISRATISGLIYHVQNGIATLKTKSGHLIAIARLSNQHLFLVDTPPSLFLMDSERQQ